MSQDKNPHCNDNCFETDYNQHKLKIHFINDQGVVLIFLDQWVIAKFDYTTWTRMTGDDIAAETV